MKSKVWRKNSFLFKNKILVGSLWILISLALFAGGCASPKNYPKLSPGMTEQQVADLLGKPYMTFPPDINSTYGWLYGTVPGYAFTTGLGVSFKDGRLVGARLICPEHTEYNKTLFGTE